MAFGRRVRFEPLREVGFAGIGALYAALGAATTDYTRIISIFNSTNQDAYISLNGGVTNHLRIASGTGQVFDLTTNKVRDDGFFIPKGTVFYQKYCGAIAPTTGNLWIQVAYADGGV